jgi:hypothetical protein
MFEHILYEIIQPILCRIYKKRVITIGDVLRDSLLLIFTIYSVCAITLRGFMYFCVIGDLSFLPRYLYLPIEFTSNYGYAIFCILMSIMISCMCIILAVFSFYVRYKVPPYINYICNHKISCSKQ